MKKVLLSLAAVTAVSAQAQTVFEYGFEDAIKDGQVALPVDSTNWGNFPGSTVVFDADGGVEDSKCLMVHVEDTKANDWERVVALRKDKYDEATSYRVTFMAKGAGKLRLTMMQGNWNCDQEWFGADKTSGQRATIELTDDTDYQLYTAVFYRGTDTDQADIYKNNSHANPMGEGEFIRFTFGIEDGEGNFLVDDVKVEKSVVKKISHSSDAIVVEYGYATTAKALANGATYSLSAENVKVVVDGEEQEVDCVEIKEDGAFCIFLSDEVMGEDSEVTVSFTNTDEGLKFSTAIIPTDYSLSFTDEKAVYDEEITYASSAWEPAKLVASNPGQNAFEFTGEETEFSFTFDKKVKNTASLKATLSGGSLGAAENLEVVAFDASETFTVKRPAGAAKLGDGKYTITVSGVLNENDRLTDPFTISFEVGVVQVAKTIYGDPTTTLLSGAGAGQPVNWGILVGGENWAGGTQKADDGNACRNLNLTADGVEYTAFYLCDRDGYTYMQYGDQEGAAITLPVGDLEFGVIAVSHDEAGHTLEFRLEDMEGNEIVTYAGTPAIYIPQGASSITSIESLGKVAVKFHNAAERNVILKVRAPQGGYTAVRVLGFTYCTYEMTEGDKYEPEVILASNFTGGNMPAEGTGWVFYDNNNALAPGSGRNSTSGMLERNFHKNMPSAAFFRECGDNQNAAHRIEYGNGNGVEGGVEIAAGDYNITYYAGTWNDAGGNAKGTSKVYFDILEAESGAVVFHHEHVNIANFENGGKCNGQADEVNTSVNLAGGKYILKAWGSHNTVWGGLSIVKPGKLAVEYHSKLDAAVEAAAAELELSAADTNNGTTKTKLAELVAKYSVYPNGMHTPAEYEAKIAEIKATTEAMTKRRETVASYDEVHANVATYMEGEFDEKFKALDTYIQLTETWELYKETTAQQLEDAELISVYNTLNSAYNKTKFMVETGVGILTEQIRNLAAKLTAVDATMGDNEVVIAAGNAISDDQEIANMLKKMVAKNIYTEIAAGTAFVEKTFDEDLQEDITTEKTIDVTDFVQNAKVYTNAPKYDACTIANYPGWTSDKPDFGMRPNYGWGGWNGDENTLIRNNDMFIGIGWVGNDGVTVTNTVENLPVGIYRVTIGTMDRSGAGDYVDGANQWPNPERQLSYIFVAQGEDSVKQAFNCENIGQYYAFTDDVMEDVTVNGELLATANIGAYIHAQESFAAIRNVRLTLVDAVEGFDYAAAAAKLGEATAIKVVERTDAPASVTYFNVNGQQTVAPQGVSIKMETYSDGYVVVKKVLVK